MPIEASKGELGVYMKSNGGPKPSRVHFRGPSFVNLSALPVMSEGEMVADVVAIIGSLDIVLGEIDRYNFVLCCLCFVRMRTVQIKKNVKLVNQVQRTK